MLQRLYVNHNEAPLVSDLTDDVDGDSDNYTQTPNLGLYKPVVNADYDLWGDHLNANADILDGILQAKAIVSDTAPANPRDGDLWFDTVNAQLYVWYVDPTSAAWVIATAQNSAALVSDLPPGNPTPGQFWFDGVSAQLFVWYVDPTGPGQWVPASTSPSIPPPMGILVPAGGSIQAAHDALPSTGGTIVLSPNTVYAITAEITISKPNVKLTAASWGTILRRDPAYTSHQIVFSGDGCVCEGFTVDGNAVVSTAGFEINVTGANCIVRNMQIINSATQGHLALGGANGRATGNTITGLGTVLSTERGYGIWALGVQTVLIDSNTVSGTGIDGIGANGTGVRIIGNRVAGCHTWTTLGGQIAVYSGSDIIVANNTIGTGGGNGAGGIEIDSGSVLVIGNTVDTVQQYGLYLAALYGGNGAAVVTGNFIRNSPTAVFGDSLVVAANVTDFVITGNRIIDDQATPTSRCPIAISPGTSDRYTITGNLLYPNGRVPAINDGGTGVIKTIANNTGGGVTIPSIGAAAIITLPASPVVTMTGFGASITSISIVNVVLGTSVIILPANINTFVGGAGTIANTLVTTAGVPVTATFDGAKWHLASSMNSGGTMQGPLGFNGNTPFGKPTGWGTSTGGARAAITASSTLPQVAAGLAQLLTDLQSYGLLGA